MATAYRPRSWIVAGSRYEHDVVAVASHPAFGDYITAL